MSVLAWMKGAGRTVREVEPHTLRALMVDSERPQPQTELVICSVVWQTVPPLTLTLYLPWSQWPAVLSRKLCHSFPYHFFLSTSGLRLACPLHALFFFFFGQIRLSHIPDIPAAYVRNSIQLLWACKISPFPSLYPSPIPDISTRPHLVCTRRERTDGARLLSRSPSPPVLLLTVGLFPKRKSDWALWRSASRPWDELFYVQQQCEKRR